MILSGPWFRLAPRRAMDLPETLCRHQAFEAAGPFDGSRDPGLASPYDGEGPAYDIAVWQDDAAHQGWLDHPEREPSRGSSRYCLPTTTNWAFRAGLARSARQGRR